MEAPRRNTVASSATIVFKVRSARVRGLARALAEEASEAGGAGQPTRR